ncbi:MAG: toprim domain-containing protein [Betaproteobacteria bacterium]|nr:MAG: toprim domain-containing protein [Betaproteobacteria bacterium]
MARIPEAEIERLKEEVSVERLIEASGIELKKAGKDKLGRCPFHEDDTASLVVTSAKNLWHCFGCGIGGGPIDWTMKRQGVSFRHAVELLKADPSLAAAPAASGGAKHSTVRKLAAPVALDADDRTLLGQVIDYYAATLKQSPEALAYLESRGLTGAAVVEAIDTFKLGHANRTLGLRLPAKSRVAGAELRTRLQKIGIYRESGHEHFNGSLVIPILDAAGNIVEVYGRKLRDDLRSGTPAHLYLPGPHAGVWNRAALGSEEVIVCEALIDALTFWCAGFRNVTSAYGIEGVTDELVEAIQAAGVRRVLIAFDRDEAGERGAAKLAERLMALGIDCFRIVFPKGMDANAYALKVKPAAKSLGLLIRKAEWMGKGAAPKREHAEPEVVTERDHLPPTSPSLAAAAAVEPAAKEETPALSAAAVPPAPTVDAAAQVSEREIVLTFGEGQEARRWRVRGLPKNLAVGVLKVNVMASIEDGRFHVDTLDLYAARARAVFLQQAASELNIADGVLKTDLGRVLLKLEALQDEAIRDALTPKEPAHPAMTDAERAEALALLQSPDLLARIVADFDACGVVGETTNKQVAYLAAVSRLLERPLAVVIQSSSAAGKSSLMDAVLSFVPEEARTQYSAMTGQSLFYMGQTNLKHKILAIAEEAGASRASYALKLLQSEGELTIASTGSDPQTGNLVTQEYRVEGPTMLMMTTTAIDLDEELLNRCLVLSVDEDREQTRAIHRQQRERRTLAGLARREAKAATLATHRNAQRLLRPLAVVNPYADRLTFLDDRTRTRRDHDKYLTLIDAIALLHQHQRDIKTASVHGRSVEYIEASIKDIEAANRIAHEVLGRSLDELPPQTRRVLGLIVAHVTERASAGAMRPCDVRFTRGELRAATGWGDTQLKLHLARLAELEYLLVHRAERGQGYVYELLYDGDAATPMHLSGLIDVAALHAYDDSRSGSEAERSAPGRGTVGGQSGHGRDSSSPENAHPAGVSEASPAAGTKSRMGGAARSRRSYPQPSLAAVA